MGPNETEKLLHNKGNYKQGEKTALRMGETNSKWSNWQSVNLRNTQAAPAAQFQKNNRPNQKIKLSTEELMLLNCGVGEDFWESFGLQGDPTSPS